MRESQASDDHFGWPVECRGLAIGADLALLGLVAGHWGERLMIRTQGLMDISRRVRDPEP